MPEYDAIIIGAGQAGPPLAIRLAKAGMKVALVERSRVGGTCVNTGCTPTKALVASAYAAHTARRAAEYGVSPDRVGIIGFSAGGAVTADVAFHYQPESRPAFVAPIYAGTIANDTEVPADAPPMFLAAATDDQLGLAPYSVKLYMTWMRAHKSAELHIYAKGGHGFGMRKQDLPVDHWIDRFADWLAFQGLLTKP